jgi:hypothetical protein
VYGVFGTAEEVVEVSGEGVSARGVMISKTAGGLKGHIPVFLNAE